MSNHIMSITLFGTCRLGKISNRNKLHNKITFCHSTKEIIQFIKFLNGKLTIPKPYSMLCFRTAICKNIYINYNDIYKKIFLDTNIFIIEICSKKKYMHNNFYLHHLCVDKRFHRFNNVTPVEILNNYKIEEQNNKEIENDILEIKKLLHPKKIIIVSHYNAKLNGEYLKSRNELINTLDEICKKNNIPFINPTNILSNFTQKIVMNSDLGHYSTFGRNYFSNYMNNYINSMF